MVSVLLSAAIIGRVRIVTDTPFPDGVSSFSDPPLSSPTARPTRVAVDELSRMAADLRTGVARSTC
jgi:hypothetical protein